VIKACSGLASVLPTAALALLGAQATLLLGQPRHLLLAGLGLVGLGWGWSLLLPFAKSFWTPAFVLLTAGLAYGLLAGLHGLASLTGGPERQSGQITEQKPGLLARLGRGLVLALEVLGANALLAYVGPIVCKVWLLTGPLATALFGSQPQTLWLGQLQAWLGPMPTLASGSAFGGCSWPVVTAPGCFGGFEHKHHLFRILALNYRNLYSSSSSRTGKLTRKCAPFPRSLSTLMLPVCTRTICSAMARPRPVPPPGPR
jgi:hypothetical protein